MSVHRPVSFHSYTLKYIALVSMIIDHSAVVFRNHMSGSCYRTMRGAGRLAFPIFCFLLVEGFFHTRDRNRYLCRLMFFAILSEVPFDLVLKGTFAAIRKQFSFSGLMEWSAQNVFFTLVLGFAAMMFMEHFQEKSYSIPAAVILSAGAGELIHCDYGSAGVITILFFYVVKKNHRVSVAAAFLPLMILGLNTKIQLLCILALPLLLCYDGEKGKGSKYLFYVAYPLHLILLLALRSLLFSYILI